MARRLFEFRCSNNHIEERFVGDTLLSLECSKCGEQAQRIISSVRSKLEGWSGAFPTAYDRWGRVHEEAARKARQRKREHEGPDAA